MRKLAFTILYIEFPKKFIEEKSINVPEKKINKESFGIPEAFPTKKLSPTFYFSFHFILICDFRSVSQIYLKIDPFSCLKYKNGIEN